ncbi:MAG UNVERIFIED_CONTAM: hypothetical protein LVQ98_00185 [Rickettsiaceae bacterium]|jgi:hypothetical protein
MVPLQAEGTTAAIAGGNDVLFQANIGATKSLATINVNGNTTIGGAWYCCDHNELQRTTEHC